MSNNSTTLLIDVHGNRYKEYALIFHLNARKEFAEIYLPSNKYFIPSDVEDIQEDYKIQFGLMFEI